MENYQDDYYYYEDYPVQKRRRSGYSCFSCGCLGLVVLVIGFLIASYIVGSNLPEDQTYQEPAYSQHMDSNFLSQQVQRLRDYISDY